MPGLQQLRSLLPSSDATKRVGRVLVSRVAIGAAMLFGLIGGAILLYQNFKPEIAANPEFLLIEESFEVSPQPDWVPGDVRADVLRDSEILKSNLLDPKLTLDVARAFGLHTWVSQVVRVRKEPGPKVIVELEYRQPLAMVEVNNGVQPGVIPIDGQAVILPPGDFSADDLPKFVRIATDYAMPSTPAGTPWGDDRVAVAAVLAEKLLPNRQAAGVYRIRADLDSARPSSRVLITLESKTGGKVILGSVPRNTADLQGTDLPQLARFVTWVNANGSLEKLPPDQVVDFRTGG